MDDIISRITTAVEKGVSFDLEVLLDDLITATKTLNNNHKEELFNQGRQQQQYYDTRIRELIQIVSSELLNIRSNQTIDPQYYYKLLKKILEILSTFQTVF